MTEPNGSTLPRPGSDEPRTGLGTTLHAAHPWTQEPPETRGRTIIADGVVEKIAGIAAREVPGIHALGGGFTRTMGAMRDRVPGGHPSAGRGVKVEVGEKQTAIDLQVVVDGLLTVRGEDCPLSLVATLTPEADGTVAVRATGTFDRMTSPSLRRRLVGVARCPGKEDA